MNHEATVFIVDDDEALRESLGSLMKSVDLPYETYASAEAFLESYDPERPGCLILDIRMPGMSGLALQEKLANEGVEMPLIIMSAHGDVEAAVKAMKAGAVDFINKPCKGDVLLDRIRAALELDAKRRRRQAQRADAAARLALLTPREQQVVDLLVAGRLPKQIAFELGLSRKTVDVHRSHIMMKLQAESLVDLLNMVRTANTGPSSADE